MKSVRYLILALSIAGFVTITNGQIAFAYDAGVRSSTSSVRASDRIEESADPGMKEDSLSSRGNRALTAKENEEHLVRLMRNRKLFPFRHRRVVVYAGMKYDAEGKPRIKEMISRLEDLGVNCYSYLIDSHSQAELDALPEFCKLASKAHIEVWVVLVPPTEEPGLRRESEGGVRYPPHGLDYQKWAEAIAKISRRHDNLTLLMIDDFLYNINHFTPGYVKKVYAILKRENQNLLFGVTIYENQLHRKNEIRPYLPYINAVEWGYQHKAGLSPNYGISAESLPGNIRDFGKMFPKALLIPCIYFTPHSSWSRKATPSYLENAMAIAFRQAGIILVFRTPYRGTANYDLVKKFCRGHVF